MKIDNFDVSLRVQQDDYTCRLGCVFFLGLGARADLFPADVVGLVGNYFSQVND